MTDSIDCNYHTIYEILEDRLTMMGFNIAEDENYDDIIEALYSVHFVRVGNIREDILVFAAKMEKAMAENDNKKGNSWKKININDLNEGLEEEVGEFKEERKNFNWRKMQKELADIANYCMMIHERLGDENNEK